MIDHLSISVSDMAAKLHPGYHGAFVLDPDGYNVEAVCHQAP